MRLFPGPIEFPDDAKTTLVNPTILVLVRQFLEDLGQEQVLLDQTLLSRGLSMVDSCKAQGHRTAVAGNSF